ncbi:hypothetical protein VCHENC02_4690, partial [Vibrio harveyi]
MGVIRNVDFEVLEPLMVEESFVEKHRAINALLDIGEML